MILSIRSLTVLVFSSCAAMGQMADFSPSYVDSWADSSSVYARAVTEGQYTSVGHQYRVLSSLITFGPL